MWCCRQYTCMLPGSCTKRSSILTRYGYSKRSSILTGFLHRQKCLFTWVLCLFCWLCLFLQNQTRFHFWTFLCIFLLPQACAFGEFQGQVFIFLFKAPQNTLLTEDPGYKY